MDHNTPANTPRLNAESTQDSDRSDSRSRTLGRRSFLTAATVAATVMIAAQVGSKATRDALFLDVFAASELPKAMLASAVLSADASSMVTSPDVGEVAKVLWSVPSFR